MKTAGKDTGQTMEDYEISVQELSKRDADSYILIDIRDDSSYSYGNIPGSLHVPKDILEADYEKYKDKPLILYCKKGETSAETVQFLKEKNIEAKSLKGGYLAWLMESMKQEEEQQDAYLDIEQSIRKKFKKSIWCKFTKAVREYELVKEGDKIDFSKFGKNDYVAYNVVAQDPNYTKRYILKIAVLPVAQDQYTFTEWSDDSPVGWANSNGAASLIPLMGAYLWPKDADGKDKAMPIPRGTADPSVVVVASRMTTGKNLGALGFIPAVTAGTLFLGEFSINLSNTLKSTKFGIPFVKEAFPKSLEVEWSYQAGAKYYATNGAKDANGKFQPVENDDDNKTLMVLKPDAPADEGSVAAVIYEVSDYTNDYLDGTNLQTATNIAVVAYLKKTTNTTMTTESVNFQTAKPFDASKKYKLAIVFSSSAKGDNFEGGEDSELSVKSVKLNY